MCIRDRVHEGEAAEVAGALDPAAQCNGLSDVFGAEFAAGVGTVHVKGGGRRCRFRAAKVSPAGGEEGTFQRAMHSVMLPRAQ